MSDSDFRQICKIFYRLGGKWENIIKGSPDDFSILEQSLDLVLS
jgi:hypothetical protein